LPWNPKAKKMRPANPCNPFLLNAGRCNGTAKKRRIVQMIKTSRLVATQGAAAALVMMATSALAQAPTDAQRSAIRSACRSDYIAHCSSVPPGGLESLQCLQKNMASLSGACKTAVNAVEAPPAAKSETPAAAPKAETPAAAEPAKPAAPAAPAAAPKAATTTAPKKPGAAPAAAGASTAAPAAGAAPAAAAAPAAVIVLRPMRPREELFVLRSACGGDVRSLCAGVQPGGGRIVQCLATNAASLSPACKDVLSQFSASR
jgi:hypothetical protein